LTNPEPGFEAAFTLLFEERFPMLYRYLQRLCGDSGFADDLAQDSFVRLYRRGSMPADPAAWLVTVANNLFRDERRNVQRRTRLLELHGHEERGELDAPAADAPMLAEERVLAVRDALEGLTPRDHRLLLLRHEGYSYREIAEALNLAPGSIGTLLIRATAAFIKAYQDGAHASE
jgi:RNA polymerase sigma-70 factor (ECF subfamily)